MVVRFIELVENSALLVVFCLTLRLTGLTSVTKTRQKQTWIRLYSRERPLLTSKDRYPCQYSSVKTWYRIKRCATSACGLAAKYSCHWTISARVTHVFPAPRTPKRVKNLKKTYRNCSIKSLFFSCGSVQHAALTTTVSLFEWKQFSYRQLSAQGFKNVLLFSFEITKK